MVQLYVIVTELVEVCFKSYVRLSLASLKLEQNVLSAVLESGSVWIDFECISHFMRSSHTFDHTPYFGETGKTDNRCSLNCLSLPIITVVIVIKFKFPWFRILSGEECICSDGWQDEYHVIFPFLVVGMIALRNDTPPGFVEGRLGGSHYDIVEMGPNGIELLCCLCSCCYCDKV